MADDKQKSALFRRHEQLKRWIESDTNKATEPPNGKARKVKFQAGCVFLAACSAGDTTEVRALLDKGGNPNTTNVDGLTALHQACIDDNIEMVKFLLDHGADINAQDNEGWTPLHATASCGYLDVAKYLIDHGADIACTNCDGDLPIDIAEGEDMEMLLAREMEKRNVDADAARSDEENRMLVDANNWLQDKRIPEVRHDRTGATALHVAAAKGYMKVMPVLLQAGADINARDFDGWTPLHAAAHWAQEDACKMLVEHMCDMEARTNSDLTVFDVVDDDLRKLLEELKEKQQSIKNSERKDGQDEDAVSLSGKRHAAYSRRSSVNRINTEEKHNMVAHKAVEEGVILTTARDENHVGTSNQDSEEEEDVSSNRKTTAVAEARAGKNSEPSTQKSNDKLEKTWDGKREEPGRSLPNSSAAENSPAKPATTATAAGAFNFGTQSESKVEPPRRNAASAQENQSSSSQGGSAVAASPTAAATAGSARSSTIRSSFLSSAVTTEPSAVTPLSDRNPEVPTLDLSETKEDDDQFHDEAFGSSFNGVYSSGLGSGGRRERVSRTNSLPSQLLERRGATSSAQNATTRASVTVAPGATAPSLQRIDSATAPDSWRAGLRKTGSSGAVPDIGAGSFTPRAVPAAAGADMGDKAVQRSASSSVLQGSSTAAESVISSANSSGYPDLSKVTTRQRPTSYTSTLSSGSSTSVPSISSISSDDRRHSASERSSASSAATPSAYIPYYRRKQIERENKEREEREKQQEQGTSGSVGESADDATASKTLPSVPEVSPSAPERRSSRFELPKRDEETETIRKMKAKQARATRRSTQGVTQEDVKAAEATLKSADKTAGAVSSEAAESRLGNKDQPPSPSATTASSAIPATVVVSPPASSTSAPTDDDSRSEDSLRRHPWQREDPGRSSFRKARDVISGSAVTPTAVPDSPKSTSVITSDDDKDKDDDDKSNSRRLRVRRNRRERRSTGISYEEGQEKPEDKEGTVEHTDDYKASSSRYDGRRPGSSIADASGSAAAAASPSASAGSGVPQRSDRSSYRQYLRNATGAVEAAGSSTSAATLAEDLKKQCEELKQENDKLKKEMQKLEQDAAEARAEMEKVRSQRNDSRVIDSGLEKRERRALERRISELEEELKNVGALKQENENLKQDNVRLKEENGALIRVISKLSK